MATKRKVVISCAVTGAIHTPSMSPYLPITAEQIADAAIGAVEAGAAIVHLHALNPVDGRPDQSPEGFAPFLKVIKQRNDCVVNITTGGAPIMTVEERVRPAATHSPEVASLNMGSMNFGLFGMLDRFKELRHPWERDYLSDRGIIFCNSFADIEYILTTCSENGTRFEFECCDTAHLYKLKYFLDRGLVREPLFIQTVFGLQGGISSHPDDVMHMRRTAVRLFGDSYQCRCWAPVATSCRLRPWLRRWAGTCGLGWRTASGAALAGSPPRTLSRCAASARSSRGWRWRSRRAPRRAWYCSSRGATRSRSESPLNNGRLSRT